jgi:hypothetical protein
MLAFLNWRADIWKDSSDCRKDSDPILWEGLQSFALSQAKLQQDLAVHFRKLWKSPLQDLAEHPRLQQDAAALLSSTVSNVIPQSTTVNLDQNDGFNSPTDEAYDNEDLDSDISDDKDIFLFDDDNDDDD